MFIVYVAGGFLMTVKTKKEIEYILIACCTYKRADALKNALSSLFEIDLPENIKTEILIVDNDEFKSAYGVVKEFEDRGAIKVNYVVEKNPGLSNVRNCALKTAIEMGATHIAFVDDDEIVDKNWLKAHIDFYETKEDIDVSSGPAYAKFDKKYPAYIMKNSVFRQSSSKEHGKIRKSCATNNVFMGLDIVQENNLYFLKDFNFTGGEDGNFFERITKCGYKIGWNEEAIAYEVVNEERANIKWILARKYYDGYMGAILRFRYNNISVYKRVVYIFEKTVTVLANIVMSLLSIVAGPTCFVNCISLTAKSIGKLLGAISLKSLYYYKPKEEQDE